MATISVPFTSGVIADGAIQERHLADGAVSLRAIDQTWPLIMRNVQMVAYYRPSKRTFFDINLRRVCSRALVTFMSPPVVYQSGQQPCGIAFNFGALSVGIEHSFVPSTNAWHPLPAVLATQDYRQAMRLTKGDGVEFLDELMHISAGDQFSTYRAEGLYGWYSNQGQTSSFLSDAAGKGVLESVWLDGMFLKFAFRSNVVSGTQWMINTALNIYAV
ncbi:MAG: hypothetical protein WA040_21150 [Anaerolineae bacterium]